jgi:hypothetical protein
MWVKRRIRRIRREHRSSRFGASVGALADECGYRAMEGVCLTTSRNFSNVSPEISAERTR